MKIKISKLFLLYRTAELDIKELPGGLNESTRPIFKARACCHELLRHCELEVELDHEQEQRLAKYIASQYTTDDPTAGQIIDFPA